MTTKSHLTPTAALTQFRAPINAASLLALAEVAGLVTDAEYLSSSGSGEIKTCRKLTDEGLRYGINLEGFRSAATDIRLYPESFREFYARCIAVAGLPE